MEVSEQDIECSYSHGLHCSKVVLQVSLRYKLQDEHHWVDGGDTANHLQDMRIAAIRYLFHHIDLIHKQLFFFGTAVICNCSPWNFWLCMCTNMKCVQKEVRAHRLSGALAILSECTYIEAF